MANTLRKVCMVLGLLLIAAALCLFVYNHREAELAAQTAEQALQEISGTSYALEQPKESDTHPIIPYYIYLALVIDATVLNMIQRNSQRRKSNDES